jgi:SAM-dependent methyltransferase
VKTLHDDAGTTARTLGLACALCREPLGEQEARCARCGVATPDVGGVRVLLADPFPALQAIRDEVLASFARSAAASVASGSDKHADAAMAANQRLYEHVTKPALAVARGSAPPSALAATFAASGEGWALTSLLRYFYADWGRPRDEVRTLLCNDARQYARAGGVALVLGCGAGGLVHDLAIEHGFTCGLDASVPTLLLARELCEGAAFECHLEKAGWKRVTLQGDAAPKDRVQWVAANGLRLPFLDGSVDVVVTQYLLDLVPDPGRLIAEMNRVLRDGGVWIAFGPAPKTLRTGEDFAACVRTMGFEVLVAEARTWAHLDTQALDPWSHHGVHGALHAVVRKVGTVAEQPAELAIRRYFAGEREALLARAPRWRPGVVPRVSRRLDRAGWDDTEVHAASLVLRPRDEPAASELVAMLREIDGTHRVGDVVGAMSARQPPVAERDVVLSLLALHDGGAIELG